MQSGWSEENGVSIRVGHRYCLSPNHIQHLLERKGESIQAADDMVMLVENWGSLREMSEDLCLACFCNWPSHKNILTDINIYLYGVCF